MPPEGDLKRKLEHDLATPITILSGYLQLVRDGDITPRRALAPMLTAALRLSATLAKLIEEV